MERAELEMQVQENANFLMDMQAEISKIENGELDFDDSTIATMLDELGLEAVW